MNLTLPLSDLSTRYSNVISYHVLRDQVIDLIVKYGEDHTGYSGAYFTPEGAPGCLLGALLADRGVTRSALGHFNQSGVGALVELGHLVPADIKTDLALRSLQTYNDQGYTWFQAACGAFKMSAEELRREIQNRTNPPVQIDAEAYVDFVAKYSAGEKPSIVLALPVHAPVEHALAA